MWQGWLSGIVGLWSIVAAFIITGAKTGNVINDLVVGIIWFVAGFTLTRMWNGWVIGILGIWFVISAFVFPGAAITNFWNDLVIGIIITVVGFLSLTEHKEMQHKTA
ncbi:hypothetical protein BMS3Abin05_01954 [bacterium BMS3Abin05]|nr:hypothetical protein BMS3Abin05_01954 [bacterium BMS3Abin05]GBE26510.1 hypothetical protein BMS3Bbin03_00423 [bacterium BMS3Bbin03]HDL78834.1 hypothetical protein [Bacteroidota bacterium]HDZ10721.1 hypothetical protein [Bacteroidota bacterium]